MLNFLPKQARYAYKQTCMTSMTMFTQSRNPSNFHTNFDIELDGFIRILAWTFN